MFNIQSTSQACAGESERERERSEHHESCGSITFVCVMWCAILNGTHLLNLAGSILDWEIYAWLQYISFYAWLYFIQTLTSFWNILYQIVFILYYPRDPSLPTRTHSSTHSSKYLSNWKKYIHLGCVKMLDLTGRTLSLCAPDASLTGKEIPLFSGQLFSQIKIAIIYDNADQQTKCHTILLTWMTICYIVSLVYIIFVYSLICVFIFESGCTFYTTSFFKSSSYSILHLCVYGRMIAWVWHKVNV